MLHLSGGVGATRCNLQPGAVFPHISYFFHVPPPSILILRVTLETKNKTTLTKRLNVEEADISNFCAGSGQAPTVNS